MIKLYHGDFLEKAKNIPDDSVDLVLTDPPYGTVKGLRLNKNKKPDLESPYGWDEAIEPKVLFTEINRILRKNGKAVLFGQEPFTSRMITEAMPNLPFSYRMIWEKNDFANGLASKKAPVNYYEDVMVFSKVDSHVKHPAKKYTNQLRKFISKENKEIFEDFDRAGYSRYALLATFNSDKARRYNFPTETTYNAMIELYKIDEMENFIPYEELERVDVEFKERFASTFNIWEEEPVKGFEDVMVFSKMHGSKNTNPISLIMKEYQEKASVFWNDEIMAKSLVDSAIASNRNSAKAIAKHKLDWEYRQPEFLTKKQYNLWDSIFNWEHTYEELKAIDDEHKKEVASTFNLWQKKKTKSNILKYRKDYDGYHPTQKPVSLLEDLVKTFSNEGDLVVDLTMGSGSTGVACKNTGRKFIGIEMDDEYFNIAKERIESHEQQLELV